MSDRKIAIVACSVGLALLMVQLIWFQREPDDPSILRRPFKVWAGNAYVAPVPPTWSHPTVQLYEDGKPLGPAHSDHAEIAGKGSGSFDFWGETPTSIIIFSTSDNSDPNTNGRTYSVFDPEARDPYEKNRRAP